MSGEGFVLFEKISEKIALVLCVILLAFPCGAAESFSVLCYHDIPEKVSFPEDVSQHIFVKQLEYIKTHGYEVISPDDIRAARRGSKSLPPKSVLLTFDDAYLSFYDFVFPVLKLYKYPAVLSVVTSWIGKKPDYVKNKELMSWKQIEEVAQSELVYIASHTHDLHKGVMANPAGNEEAATSALIYFPEEKRYEEEERFRARISNDLRDLVKTDFL